MREEALSRGAWAGALSQCLGRKLQSSQIENMLGIIGEYKYPFSLNVLLLYVAYQAGRGIMDRNLAQTMTEDLLYLGEMIDKLRSGTSVREFDPDEVLRSYLGAMKWVATAIEKGRMYAICRSTRRRGPERPDVRQVAAMLFKVQGGRR